MKTFLLTVICLLGMIGGFTQTFTLEDFRNSASYGLLQSAALLQEKKINFERSAVVEDEINGTRVRVLHLYVEDASFNNVGRIVAIRNESNKFLPNGHDFVMAYGDYSGVNEECTGIFRIYDLNWDSYLAVELELENGLITRGQAEPIPAETRLKYGVEAKPKKCDENKNGDISFGECYNCMWNECQSDQRCKIPCDYLDKYGTPTDKCKLTIAAACVWISIIS
jgi:hypothetical protein